MNWDESYQNKETPWDKGAPCPALQDFLKKHSMTGRVLVPGCGLGHDVRLIASRGARVTGIDISPTAIRLARELAGNQEVDFQVTDFFALPEAFAGAFDWIWEHTCFCAISPDQREEYAAAAADSLREEGEFLGIFYMTPDNDGEGPPFGVESGELDRIFGPAFDLTGRWTPERAFEGREGREEVRLYRKRQTFHA